MAPEWSRRAILASVGSSFVAGCSAASPTETPAQDTPTQPPKNESTTSPSPSPQPSCSTSGIASLTAESDVFTVDEKHDGFEFTLHNRTTSSLTVETTDGWEIKQHTSDGWEQVATEGGVGTDGSRSLSCEEKHSWNLALFEHPTPHGRRVTYVFVNLSDGSYKFTVTGTLDTGEEITRETEFEVQRQISSQTETSE